MARVTRELYKCDRCGHEWMPRGAGKPTVCPKCKSPYWDIPRKTERKAHIDSRR